MQARVERERSSMGTDWCGIYGHRQRDCRKKDQHMDNVRKGGKDGGKGLGKNSYGGAKGYGKDNFKGAKGYGKDSYKGGYGGFKGKGAYMSTWDDSAAGAGNQASGNGWAFSLSKTQTQEVAKPPGLNIKNQWDVFEDSGEKHVTGNSCSARHVRRTEEEMEEERIESMNRVSDIYASYSKDFPSSPIGNYSKRSVRNMGERIDMRKKGVPMNHLNLFMKEPSSSGPTKELHPAVKYKTVEDGWVKVRGVMDSGASEAVAPPTMCPHYEITPSPGSLAGQSYVSASDDLIPNLGEQVLDAETMDGRACQLKYQMADVTRPLNSVSEICDAGGVEGQHVVFGRYGGCIINLDTGRRTPFSREEGIYILDTWIKPPKNGPASVFRRPGT